MTGSPAYRTLWVGTYPVAGQGTPTGMGEGVWTAELDVACGGLSGVRQVVDLPAPSFLAHDRTTGLVYAVNESAVGALTVLRPGARGVEVIGAVRTRGADPCHLTIHRGLSAVIVANYTSGSVSVVALGPSGRPDSDVADQVIELTGSGPDLQRQASAHAHYVLATPDGRHTLVVDLGADVIRRFLPDTTARRLVEDGVAVALPPGTGPRHAVFAADGRHLYVVGELDGAVHTIDWDAEGAQGRVVASATVDSAGGGAALAHLTLRGDRLAIGVRGADLLALHTLIDGLPIAAGVQALPGAWPRHHAEVDGWTVVTQQHQGGLVVLDAHGRVAGAADVPSPACVLAAPPAGLIRAASR
jgi:6-phosphogluconolactonase (cycloisomerase 2 family)